MQSKYVSIYTDILSKIEDGTLKPNEKLKSEHELMKAYNASRDTIRKALNLLQQNGHIKKTKGKGSFVLDNTKFDFPVSGVMTFKQTVEKTGADFNTYVEKFEIASNNQDALKKLELTDSSNCDIYNIVRVRELEDERVVLDKDYIAKEYIPGLTADICKESIYDYIENNLNLKIDFAKKEITAQFATNEDAQYLDNIEQYNMVIVVRSYTYLESGELFQYTESRHRPDKFKFVDFAKRVY